MLKYINSHLEYFKDFEFNYDFIKCKNKIIGIFKNEKMYLNNQNIHAISDRPIEYKAKMYNDIMPDTNVVKTDSLSSESDHN